MGCILSSTKISGAAENLNTDSKPEQFGETENSIEAEHEQTASDQASVGKGPFGQQEQVLFISSVFIILIYELLLKQQLTVL